VAAANTVGAKNEVKEEHSTVYLSGLPFTTTQESLKEYLDNNNCTKGILQIKIVNFDDNKSKCKGTHSLTHSLTHSPNHLLTHSRYSFCKSGDEGHCKIPQE